MFDFIGALLAPLIDALVSLIVAILTPILAPVFELLAIIMGAILHFILALVANLLGAGWLALHHTGLKRFGYLLMALTSAHLLAGIALPIFNIGAATLLSWAFSPLMMLVSLALLLISAILVLASKEAAPALQNEAPNPSALRTETVSAAKDLVTHGMAIVFGFALLIGVISLSTAQTERKTLRDRLCESASAKVSQTWKDRGKTALDFSERLLKRDLKEKFPCPVGEE